MEELLHLFRDERPADDELDGETDDISDPGDADRSSSGDGDLEMLAEAIEIATATGVETAEEEGHVGSSESSDETRGSATENGDSSKIQRGFLDVVESESLNDVVNACQEAMCSLTMKRRESGSVGFE